MKSLQALMLKAKASPTRSASAWLTIGKYLSVFARFQPYVLDAKSVEEVLTIANVIVDPEDRRSKGIFTSFLKDVEAFTDKPIVIENVHNTRLHNFLLNRGYKVLQRMDMDPSISYFKRTK